jgi:tetratricopeptide (TPR) repeat protein
MILDLLAHNNWERPIYFAITIGPSKFMNLQDYFQLEGFAYRLVPIKTNSDNERINYGRVASDIMYENLFNKFKWGNMNDPSVYIDENNSRMMTNIRNNFNRLASTLVEEGERDSAIKALEKGFELVPPSVVPYEYFSLEMIETFYQTGAKDKASKHAAEAFKTFNEMVAYLTSLPAQYQLSGDVTDELQRDLFYLQKLERTCRNHDDQELAQKINGVMEGYYKKYMGK